MLHSRLVIPFIKLRKWPRLFRKRPGYSIGLGFLPDTEDLSRSFMKCTECGGDLRFAIAGPFLILSDTPSADVVVVHRCVNSSCRAYYRARGEPYFNVLRRSHVLASGKLKFEPYELGDLVIMDLESSGLAKSGELSVSAIETSYIGGYAESSDNNYGPREVCAVLSPDCAGFVEGEIELWVVIAMIDGKLEWIVEQ